MVLFAITTGGVATAVLWPFLGWWTPLAVPFVSSFATVLVALRSLGDPDADSDELERDTDEMVASLRSVLPPPPAVAASAEPGRRRAG